MKTHRFESWAWLAVVLFGFVGPMQPLLPAQTMVYLTDVPDYNWYAGCFGTASGNLAGFWDRHGYSNIYTGAVNGGEAPL
ncbi:MAG TPA: hypothetical protein VJS65_16725, partial [Verrucomicrobiae bacterium]|nr:hypothetical protein [Verrucomicrobiae bacterium]